MNQKAWVAARLTGLLALGVVFALSAGCGGPASSKSDLHFLPDNPVVIVTLRVDEIAKSGAYKNFLAETDKLAGGQGMSEKTLEEELGLAAGDIDRFVLGVGENSQNAIAVLTTKRPVTASEIAGKIKDKKFKEVAVGNFTLQSEEKSPSAFCVVDKNTVVYGETKYLKPVLERNKPVELSADMKKAMELGDQSKPVFVAVNTKGIDKAKKDLPPEAAKHAEKVEAFALDAAVASDAQLTLTALCKDEAAAKEIEKQATEDIKAAGVMVTLFAPEAAKAELNRTLEGIKISTNGNKVIGTAAVNPAVLVGMLAIPSKRLGPDVDAPPFKDLPLPDPAKN